MNSPETSAPVTVETAADRDLDATDLIEQDDLVEEVSIDGMCGVY